MYHYPISKVKIQLDPIVDLWTSPGTEKTLDLYLSQFHHPDGQDELAKNLSVLISHTEKFPSKGRHATFVTSVRPQSAILRPKESLKVTLTLFVPDYVPMGSRVLITLIIMEKPKISGGQYQQELLGQKSFQFSTLNISMKSFDTSAPKCITKFACSTVRQDCPNTKSKDTSCSDHSWTAEVLINDNSTGLRQVANANGELLDEDLEIGTFSNFTAIVQRSCCTDHVWLNVTDVAGNSAFCFASINGGNNIKSVLLFSPFTLLLFCVVLMLFQ